MFKDKDYDARMSGLSLTIHFCVESFFHNWVPSYYIGIGTLFPRELEDSLCGFGVDSLSAEGKWPPRKEYILRKRDDFIRSHYSDWNRLSDEHKIKQSAIESMASNAWDVIFGACYSSVFQEERYHLVKSMMHKYPSMSFEYMAEMIRQIDGGFDWTRLTYQSIFDELNEPSLARRLGRWWAKKFK